MSSTAPLTHRRAQAGIRTLSAVLLLGLPASLAAPVRAQTTGGGNASASIRADWLQATALPLGRSAAPSGSGALEFRRQKWSFEVGWLRAARELSTVQGGFVAISLPIRFGRAVLEPGVGVLGGVAEVSRDSTGYDFIGGTPAVRGHQPRYDYSQTGTAGGGVTLALEYPAASRLALRASAAEWMFSGKALTGDRARTLAGVGVVLRFNLASRAAMTPAKKIGTGGER